MSEYLFRDFTPYPIDVMNSKDNYLTDRDGKKYLDFIMGWCVGNIGWNKDVINKILKNFNGPNYVTPTYKYKRWEELAKKLVSFLPNKKGTCFRATGGTEAVEIALKVSKAYNKRKNFIAFKGYHGQSFGCMGLTGLHENKFGPYPNNYIRLDVDNWEKTTELVVSSIKKKDVCAFISEPIICNLGVVVPPKTFFQSVQEACKETDTVFIIDEVATGFGRTGKWFGFEHYNLDPDIITLAKGFSSGYGVIGSTIVKPEIAESMRFGFSNYSTFGWLPLSVEAAISNIEYMENNNLVEKSTESGKYLLEKLSEFCEPEGKGLCVGFDMKNKNIEEQCLKEGLIITSLCDRVAMFPALDISKEELDKGIGIIKRNY